jgi:hypothetical protein
LTKIREENIAETQIAPQRKSLSYTERRIAKKEEG